MTESPRESLFPVQWHGPDARLSENLPLFAHVLITTVSNFIYSFMCVHTHSP